VQADESLEQSRDSDLERGTAVPPEKQRLTREVNAVSTSNLSSQSRIAQAALWSIMLAAMLYSWYASMITGPELVLTHALGYQYLSGFMIGMGVGGVVGASTLGVAMFSLVAPEGYLMEFTAIVPVVNCISNLGTISVYLKHANWALCWRMWPWILGGIVIGTGLLPLLPETHLRRLTSVIYACVLAQRIYEKYNEFKAGKEDDNATPEAAKQSIATYYQQTWVMASVAVLCGVITVVTNNSGPIFNIYLLACGLDMDQFVASRSVLMAGKNVAKVVARITAGGLSWPVFLHGVQVGCMSFIGIQVAKPIKRRISTEFYMYFTWCVLACTAIKMWN